MKNNEFKIGDIVKIKRDSIYYHNDLINYPSNPGRLEGKIKKFKNDTPYKYIVLWSNDRENSYRFHDLELISSKLPKTGNEKYTLSEIEKALSTYDKEDIKDIIQTLNNNL